MTDVARFGRLSGMLSLRVAYAAASDLRAALDQEIARGVLLVKGTPPEGLAFRAPVRLAIAAPGGTLWVDTEVLSLLPGVGVVVAFPAAKLAEVRALADAAPATEPQAAPEPAAPATKATNAEKIHLALHGTREDRAAALRDQNHTLHAFVLKNPQVGVEEITAWAKSPQMTPDFLKLIGERKDWLSRPAIAQALVKNPRTPPEVALRALDYVPVEVLRQMAKGVGAAPHIVQAARRKVLAK